MYKTPHIDQLILYMKRALPSTGFDYKAALVDGAADHSNAFYQFQCHYHLITYLCPDEPNCCLGICRFWEYQKKEMIYYNEKY